MRQVFLGLLIALPLCVSAVAQQSVAPRTDLPADLLLKIKPILAHTDDFSKPEAYENMQGGAGSRQLTSRDAFSQFSANLTFAEEEQFNLGNAFFEKLWVSSPASTFASDGLGPLFNARACQSCHLKDGRGHPPENADDNRVSMFLRLSVPPVTQAQKQALANRDLQVIEEPTYGRQLQDLAVPGYKAEGQMQISYEEIKVELADGQTAYLRAPSYSISDLQYGEIAEEVLISPRVANQMIGLGLLEQIHPADILSQADASDLDGDGISGKASWVKNANGELELGRFGHKASNASIRSQSAGAFAGDLGLSTPDKPLHWGECTKLQPDCLNAPHGVQLQQGDTEVPDPIMDLVTFYAQNLSVPIRRDSDKPDVLRGKQAFYSAGCVSCHTPKYVTRKDAPNKAQQYQLIWPYTDMLLHDMGEGLSDNRPVGDAQGNEWRTPPLWGIGLTKTVSGHTYFLHDGRARNLLEAVLWHGGEAQDARDNVVQMTLAERNDLIAFLESL